MYILKGSALPRLVPLNKADVGEDEGYRPMKYSGAYRRLEIRDVPVSEQG